MYPTIQGEGKYAGCPMFLIRFSGCNGSCEFCDSKYNNEVNIELTPEELSKKIIESKMTNILFTGGEPTLQKDGINELIHILKNDNYCYFLETNGTDLDLFTFDSFTYICFSPKNMQTMRNILNFFKLMEYCDYMFTFIYDIKVVTDLKTIGMDLLDQATIIMPVTTGNTKVDLELIKEVWEYCIIHNKRFGLRLHTYIFGLKRGV